ncbi:hypothetical protein CCR85_12035 [Rhodothalassium salexigens]|uniref:TRAP transporter small permease n=1 Tax=Rhodothalassium salexigens TaxID=1086 RepID=UPI001914A67F|nr:TRAP transporter small permease [Rhodothalassium salexigens]MBK5912219.1 hypothetical protein [Rhodothalassium salexigens]MBK5919980.1 hypothetical protein [Rhodothalassium salexigens]
MTIAAVCRRLSGAIAAITRPLSVAGRNLAALLLAVMVGVVLAQVGWRYGFGQALAWSEELSRVLMIWAVFLVAPWAYRTGAHVSVTLFFDALPGVAAHTLRLVLTSLVIWVLWRLLVESLDLMADGRSLQTASLGLAMAPIYTILPASFALMALVGVERWLSQAAAALDALRRRPAAR